MASSADPPRRPRIVQRLEAQRERHRQRSFVVRALYIAVGFTLLLGGIAMLVLPGPAFLVIPVGLAVLSLEFAWAEEMLERALRQGAIAKQKAAETTKTQRTRRDCSTRHVSAAPSTQKIPAAASSASENG